MADSDIAILMKEYFVLKDQSKRLRVARNEYMETYTCESPKQEDHFEPLMQCIHRGTHGLLDEDACESCRKRHWFYTERKKNGHQCTAIMNRVRAIVNPTTEREDTV